MPVAEFQQYLEAKLRDVRQRAEAITREKYELEAALQQYLEFRKMASAPSAESNGGALSELILQMVGASDDGLRSSEVFELVSEQYETNRANVNNTLSRLGKKGKIHNAGGHWRIGDVPVDPEDLEFRPPDDVPF